MASSTTEASPAIRMRGITKRFEGAEGTAVTDLDLDVPRGAIVALIGPSGCGKTTTLRMINRLIEPTEGRIEVAGVDALAQEAVELRRGIGYVIQQIGLFPHRTIAQNIATVPKTLGWDGDRITDRTAELVDLIGLDQSVLDRYPDELSGGQQQRVGVARALAADPPVLLMDEPFGAVDPIVRGRLQDELLALQREVHKTIVLVTHDIDEALKLADRIALLNVGGVLEQFATPDELLREPANAFVERFVGEDRVMKRLQLATVADLPHNRGPAVAVSRSRREAIEAMDREGTDWVGLLEADTSTDGAERFLGWVSREDLVAAGDDAELTALPRHLPAARVEAHSTLRSAMEVIMTSHTSVAVINDDGRFGGMVTLEQVRQGLAADRETVAA